MSLSSTTTLSDLAADIMARLGDADGTIWTHNEIRDYIVEGQRLLVTETGMLWAIANLPDEPGAFSYTAAWEIDYMDSGDLVAGPANITAEFERNWTDNATEPRSHTTYWEYNDGYTSTRVPALAPLPDDTDKIERSTWNTYRVDPLTSRDLERIDTRYELNDGQVDGYLRDKDGLHTLRKWKRPATAYDPWIPVDAAGGGGGYFGEGFFGSGFFGDGYFSGIGEGTTTETPWGLLRIVTDIVDEGASGDWGIIRIFPNQESTETWGECHPFKDTGNLRIEYRRRPKAMATGDVFEIPVRYLKYLRFYAMGRAMERRGDGQNMKMAEHYTALWLAVLARVKKRFAPMLQKGSALRDGAGRRSAPPRARLPWNYGPTVRMGR